MRILDIILGRHRQTTGELGYFGLMGWWTSSFSAAEREYMEAAFCVPPLPAGAKPLTRNRGLVAFQTAAGLLTVLADRLQEQARDRNLAWRVLAKAEERALAEGDIFGLHFVYHQMIRLQSRWRDQFPDAVNQIVAACHRQIRLAPEAARVLRQMRPDEPLPIHLGYQLASALLEQEGAYQQALELCRQAQAGGWSGNWSWRIQRINRTLYERDPRVRSISSSGIRWL
ncbi:MAG: hypothetical protein MUC88_09800 [Planctomycetes bacterium]|jgi:hypothetical protein|nr:hypothetical protein [Planctomycetota bacterium]